MVYDRELRMLNSYPNGKRTEMSVLLWHAAVGDKTWATKTHQDGGSFYPVGRESEKQTQIMIMKELQQRKYRGSRRDMERIGG